jgi:hypothetical protein
LDECLGDVRAQAVTTARGNKNGGDDLVIVRRHSEDL